MVIYVGNLSVGTSEQDLLDKFEQYGRVASLNLLKDEISDRPLGFAFVEMPDSASAHRAIAALNRIALRDATLIVCETAPRIERRRFVQRQSPAKQVYTGSRH